MIYFFGVGVRVKEDWLGGVFWDGGYRVLEEKVEGFWVSLVVWRLFLG